jgi:hypothetical protein
MADLQKRWTSSTESLLAGDYQSLQNNLFGPYGLTLKLITSDGRATIVGPRYAMATVPTLPLNTIADVTSVAAGVGAVGAGIVSFGSALIAAATVPEPVGSTTSNVGVVGQSLSDPVFGIVGTGVGVLGESTSNWGIGGTSKTKAYCKVDEQYGTITVGDLLTTPSTPGHAMKAQDPIKAFGSVIGKGLRPLSRGQRLIPILVALQ